MKVILPTMILWATVAAQVPQSHQRLFFVDPKVSGHGEREGAIDVLPSVGRRRSLKGGSKGDCQKMKFYVQRNEVVQNALFWDHGHSLQTPLYMINKKKPVGMYVEQSTITYASAAGATGLLSGVVALAGSDSLSFYGYISQGIGSITGGTGKYTCAVGSIAYSEGPVVNNTYFDVDMCLTC